MGRYYSGDIEGKFWFGVQSSIDADFFGVEGQEPNYREYWYEDEHKEVVKKGIAECTKKLGKYKVKIDKFFKKKNYYNDEQLRKELDISKDKTRELLVWYARLGLGEKIEKCLKKTGSCQFQAEL